MLKRIILALCVAVCGFLTVSFLQGCATTKTVSASVLCSQIGEVVLIAECLEEVTELCLKDNPGREKDCAESARGVCVVVRCDELAGARREPALTL